MPFLARALDPNEVQQRFAQGFPRLTGEKGHVTLQAIRVIRHKPGRRCLIEYDVVVDRHDTPLRAVTLIGKVHARGLDMTSYRLVRTLWDAGFADDSLDNISVPEPIGAIVEFHLWLQRKVPGVIATQLLTTSGGADLARRIAEAAYKLHHANIPSQRRHTIADEVRILHERMTLLAQTQATWARRLTRLLEACDQIGRSLPLPRFRGIHRDFYPDQVIVDGPRLYLLDFDLYCLGDPGVDVGNFMGHLIEQSLRTLGDPNALAAQAAALEDRFVQLSGAATRAAVRAYAMLTLVRHISLSAQFPERRSFTEPLLALCEQRLGIRWEDPAL
jgi:hypothetical protein